MEGKKKMLLLIIILKLNPVNNIKNKKPKNKVNLNYLKHIFNEKNYLFF